MKTTQYRIMANDHAVYIEETLPAARETLAQLKRDLDGQKIWLDIPKAVLHIEKVTTTTVSERI